MQFSVGRESDQPKPGNLRKPQVPLGQMEPQGCGFQESCVMLTNRTFSMRAYGAAYYATCDSGVDPTNSPDYVTHEDRLDPAVPQDRCRVGSFRSASREFASLENVNRDAATQSTVADLVFAANIELDLYRDGESEITPAQARKIEAFVAKWDRA